MIHALLSLNWQVFEDINQPAGHEGLLDTLMIFGAQDALLLMPLLLLALWIGLAFALPGARSSAARGTAFAQARALGLRCTLLAVPAVVLALVFNVLVGMLVPEPRPFVAYPSVVHLLIMHARDGSFPSDHTAIAAAIATPLVVYLLLLVRLFAKARASGTTGSAASGTADGTADSTANVTTTGTAHDELAPVVRLAAIVAFLGLLGVIYIGEARVYVGVHYPGDILGGILCGAIAALLVLSLRPLLEPILAALVALAQRLRLA